MKIGVTGASGFIGRKLCKALNESDFEVYKFVEENLKLKMKFIGNLQKKKLIKRSLNP